MTKFVCWNAETGFDIVEAKHKDDAVLQCEMDQPIGMEAVLLGEEEEVKENMWALMADKKIIPSIDALIEDEEKATVEYKSIADQARSKNDYVRIIMEGLSADEAKHAKALKDIKSLWRFR